MKANYKVKLHIWVDKRQPGRNMGQREELSEYLSPAGQVIQTPAAWRYMLGDGKWRYQREWSDGANTDPVYEMTAEDSAALNRTTKNSPVKGGAITLRNPYLSL
jgi:hypothetical protein